jgi:hypothetical protein
VLISVLAFAWSQSMAVRRRAEAGAGWRRRALQRGRPSEKLAWRAVETGN